MREDKEKGNIHPQPCNLSSTDEGAAFSISSPVAMMIVLGVSIFYFNPEQQQDFKS